MNAIKTSLLDLDARLDGNARLCIGGGFGLFLKQEHLARVKASTRFPTAQLPEARTTEDIDLFLRGEVVASTERMTALRRALNDLGFAVIDSARFMQFVRSTPHGNVKIDLLSGPSDQFESQIRRRQRRAYPQQKQTVEAEKLHARDTPEAVGIETGGLIIPVDGVLSSGTPHSTTIAIPSVFTYLMMKLAAFRDRINDRDKDYGKHHAIDIYRIIGLMTTQEDEISAQLSARFRDSTRVREAREIVQMYFYSEDREGCVRIRQHGLYRKEFRLEEMLRDLATLFPPL